MNENVSEGAPLNPRLRNEEWPFEEALDERDHESDPGPSISERDATEKERGITDKDNDFEVFVAKARIKRSKGREHVENHVCAWSDLPSPSSSSTAYVITPSCSSTECPSAATSTTTTIDAEERLAEIWYFFVSDPEQDFLDYFPVKRAASEASAEDLRLHAKEAREAALAELEAWVKQKAGRPATAKDFKDKTGLTPVPSRWVNTWKLKDGILRLKRRLVLKGFAERYAQELETASPTASRIGHRIVMLHAARHKTKLVSYDVSTAFLQGDSIDQHNDNGHTRQQVGFKPPPEVWEMLHTLEPNGGWLEASLSPDDWIIWLDKGAYGLKDAPLLWFLRIQRFMREHHYIAMKHDSCMFYELNAFGAIDVVVAACRRYVSKWLRLRVEKATLRP